MSTAFTYSANPGRVVFGAGTIDQVQAEVERLGRRRVMVLASPRRPGPTLGPLEVARFEGAAQHTPVEVTESALAVFQAADADCVVAVGGGSTIGLSKALADRTDVDQIVLPTTYAGSELTALLGETSDGVKTTRSSARILPETVIYDVELSRTLPRALAGPSAVNALAHAVEALYSPDASPVTDAIALEAITRLGSGLRRLDAAEARSELLLGAYLAGTCLGSVSMGLHHKLAHVLGGTFALDHARTHTVLLPQVMAFNAPATGEVMSRIARALGVRDAPSGVHALISGLGGPTALRDLGLSEADLPQAVEQAFSAPYANPRPVDRAGLEAVLRAAWNGTAPSAPAVVAITDQVLGTFAGTPDPRLRQLLLDLVPRLHDYAEANDLTQAEWQYAIEFLTRTGQLCSDVRQEFILLSDTLGLSSVVDVLTNSRTPDTTPSAVLGPFYVEGPPELPPDADVSGGLPGTALFADVLITDTLGQVVADAVVDVWQSNDDGFYDVQLPDLDGPVLRARLRSDPEGRVRFRSILPSEYPIPTDGTVGAMLAATGRHPYRAPHLHFMIMAEGYQRLITQLFVAGGKYLDSDAVFGVKDALIVDYEVGDGPSPDGRFAAGEWRSLAFTFRIQPA